jgi:hypothetical protein
MSIYHSANQSKNDNFKPTRLYIKKLENYYYFGKTTLDDVETYSGSGVIWKKIIKKYGKENIKTIWVSDWYKNAEEIQQVALHFSEENNIVESNMWANCKIEDGLDGGAQPVHIVKTIADKNRGRKHSEKQCIEKSKRQSGKKKSQKWIDNRPGYDKNIYCWENIDTGEKIFMNRRDFRDIIISQYTEHKNQAAYAMITGSTMYGWRIYDENKKSVSFNWTCHHCGKTGTNVGAHNRWHGDNCSKKER